MGDFLDDVKRYETLIATSKELLEIIRAAIAMQKADSQKHNLFFLSELEIFKAKNWPLRPTPQGFELGPFMVD